MAYVVAVGFEINEALLGYFPDDDERRIYETEDEALRALERTVQQVADDQRGRGREVRRSDDGNRVRLTWTEPEGDLRGRIFSVEIVSAPATG